MCNVEIRCLALIGCELVGAGVRVLFENSIVCQCTFVCGLVACLVVLAVPDVFGCGWCVPVVLPLNL